VPTWDEWGQRTAADNRQLRQELLQRGEFDGYLLYADGKAAGWCQVGKRDRLSKLSSQFNFGVAANVWALTCFQIDPELRRRGLAGEFLKSVLAELKQRGVKRVQGYPKIDPSLPAHSQWTGPLGLYEQAGFRKIRDNKTRAVYELEL
jgi:GNAT superfamily N-acetyltransferase